VIYLRLLALNLQFFQEPRDRLRPEPEEGAEKAGVPRELCKRHTSGLKPRYPHSHCAGDKSPAYHPNEFFRCL
jgi:hypothetical protein